MLVACAARSDYPFAQYVSIRMADLAAEVVDIEVEIWAGIWLIFVIQWSVMHMADFLQARGKRRGGSEQRRKGKKGREGDKGEEGGGADALPSVCAFS